MRKRRTILSLLLLLVSVAASGCSALQGELHYYESLSYFGGTTQWIYLPRGEDVSVWNKICAAAGSVEESVSPDREGGSVARFNAAAAGERVEIDAVSYELLCLAQEAYTLTGGAFDPATGALVDLWGFSPRFRKTDYAPQQPYDRAEFETQLPEARYLEAFSSLTNVTRITLSQEGDRYYAVKPEDAFVEVDGECYTMQLTLGGLAKGYCTDVSCEIVRGAGYEDGFLSFDGSSIAVLRDPVRSDGIWGVEVRHPRSQETSGTLATLRQRDVFLASSGDYQQYYEIGGVRYSHIIDPATGYPVNAAPGSDGSGIVCASVVGASAAMCDALSTAIMVMGRERAISFVRETLSEYSVLFVFRDAQGALTLYHNFEEGTLTLNDRTIREEAI